MPIEFVLFNRQVNSFLPALSLLESFRVQVGLKSQSQQSGMHHPNRGRGKKEVIACRFQLPPISLGLAFSR